MNALTRISEPHGPVQPGIDLRGIHGLAASEARAEVESRDVSTLEISVAKAVTRGWDSFAARSRGWITGTIAHQMIWVFRQRFKYKLRMFEFNILRGGQLMKIGQCSVCVSPNRAVFHDRINILDDYKDCWKDAMTGVLAALGDLEYEYGWKFSLEEPRDREIARIPGVSVISVTPLTVQAIDFSQWPDWESYYWGMRKGARQSSQHAHRDMPDLSFKTWEGFRSVFAIPTLLDLRLALSRRKDLGFTKLSLLLRYLGEIIISAGWVETAVAISNGSILSVYYGIEFGDIVHYMDAASVLGNQGAGWALLISRIQRAYSRRPHGKFIMGYVNYAMYDESRGGGLLQSRAACRASDFPTSITTFKYSRPGG